MKRTLPLLLVVSMIAACSSGGTFTPTGAKIIFTELIDSRASKLSVTAGNSNIASIEPLMELLDAGKSNARPSVVQKNIMSAAQPGNIVQGIGDGVKDVMLGLGAVETKESRMVEDQYIAETTLYSCEVKENPDQIYIRAEAELVIKHRVTGDVVWSESIDKRVDLVPILDGKRKAKPSAEELAGLVSGSEEDITKAVKAATATIGHELAQQMRKTPTKWDVAPGR